MASTGGALLYTEPGIVVILVLSSFLLLANAINAILNRILFCGLVGQVLIGVAWGAPGGHWLSLDVQNAVMQLGYLGLILIVFEGGLSTNIKTVRSNLWLSSVVAAVGTSAPIALSFALKAFLAITSLQAFAAGAALCSTSLGTTFTILSTCGLNDSRLGVVLSSAAMIDDVIGLVMSGIISNLGQSHTIDAADIVRPILVSVAFAVVSPLICLWVVKPLTVYSHGTTLARAYHHTAQVLGTDNVHLTAYLGVLVAFVTGSSYAGTSNLFAAYLAGVVVTWWDDLVMDMKPGPGQSNGQSLAVTQISSSDNDQVQPHRSPGSLRINSGAANNASIPESDLGRGPQSFSTTPQGPGSTYQITGAKSFAANLSPVVNTVFQPFFFASIGFSIPISRMFTGDVLWRGIVYSVLMIIAKLLCGLCLVRCNVPTLLAKVMYHSTPRRFWANCRPGSPSTSSNTIQHVGTSPPQGHGSSSVNESEMTSGEQQPSPEPATPRETSPTTRINSKPLSLYPAAMLGAAMVARGEIGFLISSVAESGGLYNSTSSAQSSELYLIVTWAILLCTIVGPLSIGLLVRRVKWLQSNERGKQSGKADPLGSWGVSTRDP